MNEMNANAVETKEPENATASTPPKIIAVDFDGCLAVNKWPEVGEPIWKNINRLKEEQANGTKVILWTNRVGEPWRRLWASARSMIFTWTQSTRTCLRSSRPLAGTAGRSLPMSIGMTGRC